MRRTTSSPARSARPSVPKRPTSSDVARLAGVSRATVSYVLNGNREQAIPEVTRKKVLAAAGELGYTPHAAAAALRAGRSNLVLLVVRDMPYGRNLGALVDHLAARAATHGLSLVTWQDSGNQTLPTTLGHLMPRLVLSHHRLPETDIRAMEVAGIPSATMDEVPGAAGIDELTGSLSVHHLADVGHRHLGYVGASDADLALFAEPRAVGVRRGALDLGLEPPREASLPVPPAGTLEEVVEVLADWRAGPQPVTAICCYNDYLAARVLRAARVLGLRVPEDLAVVGVDDEPMSGELEPPLTSVRPDMVAMADRLFALGMARVDGGDSPPRLPSSTLELVVRRST